MFKHRLQCLNIVTAFIGGRASKSLTSKAVCDAIAPYIKAENDERLDKYKGLHKKDLRQAIKDHELEWTMPFVVSYMPMFEHVT